MDGEEVTQRYSLMWGPSHSTIPMGALRVNCTSAFDQPQSKAAGLSCPCQLVIGYGCTPGSASSLHLCMTVSVGQGQISEDSSQMQA